LFTALKMGRSEIVLDLIAIQRDICSSDFARYRLFAQPLPKADLATQYAALATAELGGALPCG
jgi:hypothetical protein